MGGFLTLQEAFDSNGLEDFIAQGFEAAGFDVWWDQALRSGEE